MEIRFVRLFDPVISRWRSYFVIRGRWFTGSGPLIDTRAAGVEYGGYVRWLGYVMPLPE